MILVVPWTTFRFTVSTRPVLLQQRVLRTRVFVLGYRFCVTHLPVRHCLPLPGTTIRFESGRGPSGVHRIGGVGGGISSHHGSGGWSGGGGGGRGDRGAGGDLTRNILYRPGIVGWSYCLLWWCAWVSQYYVFINISNDYVIISYYTNNKSGFHGR